MIKLLPGCSIRGIREELSLGLIIAGFIFYKHGALLELTHCTDGTHGIGSLHYVGQAGDIRTFTLTEDLRDKILAEIKLYLGAEFDFFFENDHFHMEFQPKGAINVRV